MRILSAILILAAALVATGCGRGVSSTQAPSPAVAPSSVPSLMVRPQSDVLGVGGTRTFIANMAVTWTVQEAPAGGTITSNGTYTAPGVTGTYHVIARSVADANNSVTSTVSVVSSGFTFSGSMNTPRLAHTATLLPSGKVLVVGGGDGPDMIDGFFPISQAELFDPSTATFAAAGTATRDLHTATLLLNGKVLIAGGETGGASITSDTAELYDPSTGTFQPTGSMSAQRESHTATLLNDGRVLVAGGYKPQGISFQSLNTAEIYDPATGSFTPTGDMAHARGGHTATLLVNGKVLLTGGGTTTAEVYDPVTRSFTAAGSMAVGRSMHAATLLATGQVLVTGGTFGAPNAELYDPSTASFSATGSLAVPRSYHSATLLPNGTVLIAGGMTNGTSGDSDTATAEIFDPATASFKPTGSMGNGRFWHTSTLLPDGTVVVTGGAQSPDGLDITTLKTSEIYK